MHTIILFLFRSDLAINVTSTLYRFSEVTANVLLKSEQTKVERV